MKDFERFNNKAKIYDKYRPNYPEECLHIILKKCKINQLQNISVAEIGSGTGKFTKLLLDQNFSVYAIEPNSDMRNLAETKFANNDNFYSINALAEKTTLVNNSIDLIFIAQAFHYFNNEKSLSEFKRILKDNGQLILLWNFRSREVNFIQDYEKLIYKYHSKKTTPTFAQDKMSFELFDTLFENYEIFSLPNNQEFTSEDLWNRTISSNHAPKSNEKIYWELKEKIHELFDKYQVDGKIIFPHYTKIVIGNLK